MNKKFDFYDIVEICSNEKENFIFNGELGVIRGIAEDEERKLCTYGVSLYKENGIIRRFNEFEILFTGKKANPIDFTTSEKIQVQVDPETGEGRIIDTK